MSAASEVLEDAADVIERDGWVQGYIGTTDGVCAVGAIYTATGHWNMKTNRWDLENINDAPRRALAAHLGLAHADGGDDIPQWNDAPGRTKEEVLDALRGAAKQERLKEEGLL